MAQTINILPDILASKIAAGEVVGRPASVVKELLENSLDAKAKSITIIVKEAGKGLIHVIDDGCGMSPEDARVAFGRHATSKIATYEDLENIQTFGFRGEALASIAAVSHVEMRTRRREDTVGTKARVEGGTVVDVSEEGGQPGTSIAVRNLFYNTPARRHFLKGNTTEFRHIFDAVQRAAMSNPECAFKFLSDDETILDVRSTSLDDRMKDLFGEKLYETLFYFEDQAEFISLLGFLGKPNFARKSRIEQYLFLNGRTIVSRSINHAVFQAYENLLEKGSFPFFVLNLKIDPRKVDVNVHPSKMEVKFDDEQAIYRFVLSAVRKALSSHDLFPAAGMREESSHENNLGLRFRHEGFPSGQRVSNWQELLPVEPHPEGIPHADISPYSLPSAIDESLMFKKSEELAGADSKAPAQLNNVGRDLSSAANVSLWQIHNKYIIVPTESGIMLIDQHAAHERVLFERVLARMNGHQTNSQQLLFPQTVEMNPADAALVKQLQPLLEQLGFSLKVFGKTTIIVDGIPTDVKPGDEGTILQDVLDLFKEDEQTVKIEPRERLAKTFACKAAIKAGDPLNIPEMKSLLDQLFATEIPYVCPHGRPVIVKLTISELDRRFGRTS